MSDLEKLTDLLWGYDILTEKGLVLRKFRFMSAYPDEAKKLIEVVYPEFYHLSEEAKMKYRVTWLSEKIFKLIGFTAVRTKFFR